MTASGMCVGGLFTHQWIISNRTGTIGKQDCSCPWKKPFEGSIGGENVKITSNLGGECGFIVISLLNRVKLTNV